MLKPSEILEGEEPTKNLANCTMSLERKHEWIIGILVPIMIILNTVVMANLPRWFEQLLVYVYAVISQVPYEVMLEVWSTLVWMQGIGYYLIPAVVVVLLCFLECLLIGLSSWYRAVGDCVIVIYLTVSWSMLNSMRWSLALLMVGNYVFIPVLLLYAVIGVIYSYYKWIVRHYR